MAASRFYGEFDRVDGRFSHDWAGVAMDYLPLVKLSKLSVAKMLFRRSTAASRLSRYRPLVLQGLTTVRLP